MAPIFLSRFVWLVVVHMVSQSIAEYEPAGCSDEGCGIPCYMRPVEDPCHYQQHSPCNDEGSTDLEQWFRNLNSSLHRLENKLIQKGVIPAGDTCKPLTSIDYGGVIYSDLLLSPGVIANYVCQDGYSLFGYPNRTCATDGTWIGGDKEDPVCQDPHIECTPLLNIPYGHVHYSSVDTTEVNPGDVVTYSCDPPYVLEGAEYRICMNNGSWSEEQPQCIEPPSSAGRNSKPQGIDDKAAVIAGTITGICVGVILTVLIGLLVFAVICKRSHNKKGYETLPHNGNNTDGNSSNTEQRALKEGSLQNVKQDQDPSVKLDHGHIEILTPEH